MAEEGLSLHLFYIHRNVFSQVMAVSVPGSVPAAIVLDYQIGAHWHKTGVRVFIYPVEKKL